MNKLSTLLLSLALATSSGFAIAQDAMQMKKGSMSKDTMHMDKGSMSKDVMHQDEMNKDTMDNGAMMKKEAMRKPARKPMPKDDMEMKDGMGK